MSGLELIVYGIPAPQGSKRHVGRGIMVESSAKVKPWREAIKWAYLDLGMRTPIEGPVSVRCVFNLPKPKSAKKDARPDKRPDLDKLLRSTFDGLGEAGVWVDDSQVVSVEASKWYVSPDFGLGCPGAYIWITSRLSGVDWPAAA